MAIGLEGIKVIDISQVAAVPMAARILADFGADVIHIENPKTGDSWRAFQDGQMMSHNCAPSKFNYNWENFNRNKRSVTIDLYTENGRNIIHKMVEQADMLLTNLRSFELDRFKLDYQILRQINPRLIYGNITGYGKEGPDKELPAYDTTAYWARCGFPYMLSMGGIPCLGYRPAMGDNVAALALISGLMTALYLREKTGTGQEINISLLHIGFYQISFDVSGALITGMDPSEWRDMPPPEVQQRSRAAMLEVMDYYNNKMVNPLSASYMTKDMRYILFVILQPDRYWDKFCRIIGRSDLAEDSRYNTIDGRATHIKELRQAISQAFMTKTLDEWRPLLEGIPFSPMQSLKEAINDPQARASHCFVSYNHPELGTIEQVANPIIMSETPATVRMPAPEFGQHTEEVLLEYGYSWDEIAHFKEEGVIA